MYTLYRLRRFFLLSLYLLLLHSVLAQETCHIIHHLDTKEDIHTVQVNDSTLVQTTYYAGGSIDYTVIVKSKRYTTRYQYGWDTDKQSFFFSSRLYLLGPYMHMPESYLFINYIGPKKDGIYGVLDTISDGVKVYTLYNKYIKDSVFSVSNEVFVWNERYGSDGSIIYELDLPSHDKADYSLTMSYTGSEGIDSVKIFSGTGAVKSKEINWKRKRNLRHFVKKNSKSKILKHCTAWKWIIQRDSNSIVRDVKYVKGHIDEERTYRMGEVYESTEYNNGRPYATTRSEHCNLPLKPELALFLEYYKTNFIHHHKRIHKYGLPKEIKEYLGDH